MGPGQHWCSVGRGMYLVRPYRNPLQHATVLVPMRRPGQVKPRIRIYVLTLAAVG